MLERFEVIHKLTGQVLSCVYNRSTKGCINRFAVLISVPIVYEKLKKGSTERAINKPKEKREESETNYFWS